MNEVSLAANELAQRLIALEARHQQGSETGLAPALRVVDTIRQPLSNLAGTTGCRSLLTRSLTLASAYTPWLRPLRIEPDCSVQWAGGLPYSETADEAADGGAALVAELIGLLILFIGEALTLQLVRAAWPGATLDYTSREQKETLR